MSRWNGVNGEDAMKATGAAVFLPLIYFRIKKVSAINPEVVSFSALDKS